MASASAYGAGILGSDPAGRRGMLVVSFDMLFFVASLLDQCIKDPLSTADRFDRSRELKVLGLRMVFFLFTTVVLAALVSLSAGRPAWPRV